MRPSTVGADSRADWVRSPPRSPRNDRYVPLRWLAGAQCSRRRFLTPSSRTSRHGRVQLDLGPSRPDHPEGARPGSRAAASGSRRSAAMASVRIGDRGRRALRCRPRALVQRVRGAPHPRGHSSTRCGPQGGRLDAVSGKPVARRAAAHVVLDAVVELPAPGARPDEAAAAAETAGRLRVFVGRAGFGRSAPGGLLHFP